MPAAVETMAYTNEVPWHGLGNYVAEAPDVPTMLKLAGLDWRVERRPMFSANGQEIEGFAALTRDKDNRVFDVVGSRYRPAQNDETFQFFDEFVRAGQATMETAGALRGGRLVWGLAKLNADFTLPGNDQVKSYLLLASPHEQGKSLVIKCTNVRVVCMNTMAVALREAGNKFSMNHTMEFSNRVIERAKDILGLATDQLASFESTARSLKKRKMKDEEVIETLQPFFQPQTEVKDILAGEVSARMTQVLGAYRHAPGATPGDAWGVFNAVTYYADHLASRTQDKRLTNAWFGKTANLKEAVLEALVA